MNEKQTNGSPMLHSLQILLKSLRFSAFSQTFTSKSFNPMIVQQIFISKISLVLIECNLYTFWTLFCRVNEEDPSSPTQYRIEFTFDTDVACAVRVYLFATENLAGGIAR